MPNTITQFATCNSESNCILIILPLYSLQSNILLCSAITLFSTTIQQNIYTMLHEISTPQSSQCQRMYTLYFPLPCTILFTCTEMHLFTSLHNNVYAVACIMWFKLQYLAILCNRRKRTLILGHSIPKLFTLS